MINSPVQLAHLGPVLNKVASQSSLPVFGTPKIALIAALAVTLSVLIFILLSTKFRDQKESFSV